MKSGRNIITPIVSLQYVYLDLDDYIETGAGGLNLAVEDEHYDIIRSGLGVKIARPTTRVNGTWIPQVHAMWLHEFAGEEVETTATFTGGGGSFETKGIDPSRNSLNLGVQLTWITKGQLTFVIQVS